MSQANTAAAPVARTFERVRAVTHQVLKIEKGVPRYFAILGAMHQGKKIDDTKEAATLVHALDMVSGEEGVVIVSTVMGKELAENYPGDSYVGRGFEVVLTRDTEKRYNHVSLTEVAIPEDIAPAVRRLMGERSTPAAAPAPAPAPAKGSRR